MIFNLILILLLTGICITFLGWIVHWIFHQSWSAWFYQAHMNHHLIQYPPYDFLSDKYRNAGKDNTVVLFIIAFLPLLALIILLTVFNILSLTTCICSLVCLGLWGYIHDYIHDQFHLNKTFWDKFSFFLKWRKLHYVHHLNVNSNFGIITYQWDKLFKTFIDEEEDTNETV